MATLTANAKGTVACPLGQTVVEIPLSWAGRWRLGLRTTGAGAVTGVEEAQSSLGGVFDDFAAVPGGGAMAGGGGAGSSLTLKSETDNECAKLLRLRITAAADTVVVYELAGV